MGWKNWKGKKLKKLTRRNMSKALHRAAEATLGESKQQVPLDEGTLQHSGIVVQNPSNDLEFVISYGGGQGTGFPVVPYAVKWHEVPANFQHGRKNDYLRDPINTFAPGAVQSELKKAGERSW